MAWPDETAVVTGVTAGGTAWRRARVQPNGAADRATICAPTTVADGAQIKLVVATHGTGGSDATMDAGSAQTVRDALLDAGYVVVAANLHGNTWGNSVAMADLANLYAWCAALWNVQHSVFFGQSQGGGVVLTATRRKVIPTLRAVAAVAPALNYQWVSDSGGSSAAIRTAYDATASTFASKVASSAPLAAQPVDYAGMHVKLWASNGDATTPKVNHSDQFKSVASRCASLMVMEVTGDHLSVDHYRPQEVVDFYAASLAAGNVDPGDPPAENIADATVFYWDGAAWVPRSTRVWTGTEWALRTPLTYG